MITQFSPIPEGFFGESGLTATSANHIANLLKMRYEAIENELNSVNFTEEKMQIIGSSEVHTCKKSYVIDDNGIKIRLDMIAGCKGFIAFLREAIKCKGELASEIEEYKTVVAPPPTAPVPKRPITENDVINSMSIGDRVTYLATEAGAATYGKYIHPGGHLDKMRQRAFDAFSEPDKVANTGRETVFIKFENAITVDEIDGVIMELKSEHRKWEAQLNGIKHGIEETVKKDAQDKLDAYRKEKAEYDKAMDEYNRMVANIDASDQQTRIDRRKLIEGLKIIIPNQYRDLYNEVNG